MTSNKKRHWSFWATDQRLIYFLVSLVFFLGTAAAFYFGDATGLSRAGNFIVALGVWISLRSTLRDGINKYKDASRSIPVFSSGQLNVDYFNETAFSIGDARLQLHGFGIVIFGSAVGSVGDIVLRMFLPTLFHS